MTYLTEYSDLLQKHKSNALREVNSTKELREINTKDRFLTTRFYREISGGIFNQQVTKIHLGICSEFLHKSNPNYYFHMILEESDRGISWKFGIKDNHHHILMKISNGFGILDQAEKLNWESISGFIEFVQYCKLTNYCYNCGDMLDMSSSNYMSCDNQKCLDACSCYLLDDYVTSEYKRGPVICLFLIENAYNAISSNRSSLIYNPRPPYLEELANSNGQDVVDYLKNLLHNNWTFVKIKNILSKVSSDQDLFELTSEEVYAFIKYTIKSNKTLIHIDNIFNSDDITTVIGDKLSDDQVRYLNTQFDNMLQFRVEHPAMKEEKFKKAAETCYLYHGSILENWYSILRNGIKIASKTKLQLNGAAHGVGVYLSDSVDFSYGYSGRNGVASKIAVAVFEVIGNRKQYKKTSNIFVVDKEDVLILRYLLVFTPGKNGYAGVGGQISQLLNHKFSSNIKKNTQLGMSKVQMIRTKRLMKEYQSLVKQGPEKLGFRFKLATEDNLQHWRIFLNDFSDNKTLAADLKKYGIDEVEIEITFEDQYPLLPPFIRIVHPRFEFHTGHITLGGSLCMELLTNQGWSPTYSVENVIIQIKLAISEGGGKLDQKNYNQRYTLKEAKEAFNRVAARYGWV